MTRGLWIMAGIALAGLVLMVVLSQSMVQSVGGVEEARALQGTLRAVGGRVLAEDPPPGVFRMPPAEGEKGWRWMVEATLRPGSAADDPEVLRVVGRMVLRALTMEVQGSRPAGVLVRLLRPGAGSVDLVFDGDGRLLGGDDPGAPAAGGEGPAPPPPADAAEPPR